MKCEYGIFSSSLYSETNREGFSVDVQTSTCSYIFFSFFCSVFWLPEIKHILLVKARCADLNQIAAASDELKKKIRPENLVGEISQQTLTEHVELITHLFFLDTFFSARMKLLKEILENESTPVSSPSQIEHLKWRQVVHLQSLGQEEWCITIRPNQVWCGSLVLCGLQHIQAPLFSEGKLVVGMMSPNDCF